MSDARWMRGVEWLSAAATDPRLCKREWDHGDGVALLEAGRYWDVLSVPDRLGLLTLDLLWQTSRPVPGPTLVDTAAHRVGFFLPPDPGNRWIGAGLRRAGRGSWVAVPPLPGGPFRGVAGAAGRHGRAAPARHAGTRAATGQRHAGRALAGSRGVTGSASAGAGDR